MCLVRHTCGGTRGTYPSMIKASRLGSWVRTYPTTHTLARLRTGYAWPQQKNAQTTTNRGCNRRGSKRAENENYRGCFGGRDFAQECSRGRSLALQPTAVCPPRRRQSVAPSNQCYDKVLKKNTHTLIGQSDLHFFIWIFQCKCTPHDTSSLSITKIIIGFEGGPPILRQGVKLPCLTLHKSTKNCRTIYHPFSGRIFLKKQDLFSFLII